MSTKVLRLKLYPPDYPFNGKKEEKKEAWKQFKGMVRELAYQASQVKNIVASRTGLFFLQKKEGQDVKQPKDTELYHEINKILKQNGDRPIIARRLVSANLRIAKAAFSKKHGDDIWKGNRALPTFRRDGAVYMVYDSEGAGQGKTGGSFRFEGETVRIAMWTRGQHNPKNATFYNFPIFLRNMTRSQKIIFERIRGGEYQAGTSTLNLKRWDVYLNVTYTFDKKQMREVVSGRVVGVDIGMRKVAVCSCSDNEYARLTIHDEVAESIRRHRQRIQRLKKSASRALRPYTEKRSGHGIKNKLRTLEHLSGKERDFQQTVNHQVSRAVVNFALRLGAEAIAVEDLSGIYESSKIPARWLRRWAYDELQRFIEYKAGEHGIKFIKVEAAGTSQTCSKCGHRDRANRKSQAQFECINCGHTENADLNASRNIAVLGMKKYAQSA